MKSKKQKKWLKLAILALIILGSIVMFEHIYAIKEFIQTKQKLAWLIYLLAWIILPIFFFPVPILAMAGGVLFELFQGSILTIIGAMINMSLMFYIGKFLKFDKFSFEIKDDFMSILILRFIPFVPYNLLNYACGFLNLGFKNYIFASFVGILPATVILLNLGQNAIKFGTAEFYWSVLWFVLLIVFSLFFKQIYQALFLKR